MSSLLFQIGKQACFAKCAEKVHYTVLDPPQRRPFPQSLFPCLHSKTQSVKGRPETGSCVWPQTQATRKGTLDPYNSDTWTQAGAFWIVCVRGLASSQGFCGTGEMWHDFLFGYHSCRIILCELKVLALSCVIKFSTSSCCPVFM